MAAGPCVLKKGGRRKDPGGLLQLCAACYACGGAALGTNKCNKPTMNDMSREYMSRAIYNSLEDRENVAKKSSWKDYPLFR